MLRRGTTRPPASGSPTLGSGGGRGFTLLEVIVVLAILAIVAAAAAPALIERRAAEPGERVAEELRQLFGRARLTALARARPVVVVIDPATGAYRVDLEAGGEASRVATGRLDLAGARLQVPSPRVVYRFDPFGGVAGDPIVVHGEVTRLIRLHPWSGALDVQEVQVR